MKTAVIIGSQGQDGVLLGRALTGRGYRVVGIGRNSISDTKESWKTKISVTQPEEVDQLVRQLCPDHIYFLVAVHQSSQGLVDHDESLIQSSFTVNVAAFYHVLNAVRKYSPSSRLFYAASSLIFGAADSERQDEMTPFRPDSVYGITKLNGLLACRYARLKHNIFASCGIMYNHESELRSKDFISRKIVQAAVAIKAGKQDHLVVGDLLAETDWGFAPDYVEAMIKVLEHTHSDDFVIATGQKHTVKDFVHIAFECVGLDWIPYVREDKSLLTRRKVTLVGDAGKLRAQTGWQPTINFRSMVEHLIKMEIEHAG